MEKAKEDLGPIDQHSEAVSQLDIAAQRVGSEDSFYELFALRGIRVDRVEPEGLVVCTFKVPPRLTDRDGNFASGAIANLVDVVGNSTIYQLGRPSNVSVDMSISYMSKAKIDDELEITSKKLGQRGTLSRNNSGPQKQSNWRDYCRRSTFIVSFKCSQTLSYSFAHNIYKMKCNKLLGEKDPHLD